MNLRDLQPQHGAKLTELRDIVRAGGWCSLLPEALPDSILLMLALDFRVVEANSNRAENSEEGSPSLSAALFVVTNLLLRHPARTGDQDAFVLTESGMVNALQIYKRTVEHEVLTRITGVAKPESALLDGLLQTLND